MGPTRSAIFLLCCFVTGVAIATPQKKGGPKTEPIDATLRDDAGDKIRSDGFGAYLGGNDGADLHLASGSGNFIMDLDGFAHKNDPPFRVFNLFFDSTNFVTGSFVGFPENGSGDPLFFDGTPVFWENPYPTEWMTVNASGLDCDGAESAAAPATMGPEDCLDLTVSVNFANPHNAKSSLMLRCGDKQGGLDRSETDYIEGACAADDGAGTCIGWNVQPSASGQLRCRLFEHVHAKGVHDTFRIADFDMRFGFTDTAGPGIVR